MITNEVQYRATKAHLERFEQAAANIEARPGKRTKLDRLQLDAVRAQADDLRVTPQQIEPVGRLGQHHYHPLAITGS